MVDAVARREARRKRILENSENRFRIISGLPTVDGTGDLTESGKRRTLPSTLSWEREETETETEFPEFKPIIPTSSSINSDGSCTEQIRLQASLKDQSAEEPFLLSNQQQSADSLLDVRQPLSIFATILSSQFHVVGLALFVRLLLASSYSTLFGESIFVPFFTVQMVKYFGNISYIGDPKSNGSILQAALLFSGVPGSVVVRLTRLSTIVKDLLESACLYFFSFVILHVLLELFNS